MKNEETLHAIVGAIQHALDVTDGGFADLYFDNQRWERLSRAIKDNESQTVLDILSSYVNAEKYYQTAREKR